MDIEKEINEVLFKMVQNIKIHQIDKDNSVLEISYDQYTIELLRLFRNYLKTD